MLITATKEIDLNIRSQFLVPNSLYFLSHSVGCLPRDSKKVTEYFFSSWQDFGGESWELWFEYIEQFKINLALLLNAKSADEICPQNNVSSALTKIISSLPKRTGRKKILISETAFPSVGFAAKMADLDNYELEFIPADLSYEEILTNWAPYFKTDIQLVIITHALSNNSLLYPVKELVELAQKQDIYTVIDVAASIGIKEVNASEWNADFIVGTCLKWLCGGPGTGFLWVNQKNIKQFKPREVGWFSHLEPSQLDIRHFEYAHDARRFWGGTPSILPFLIASESIRILLEIGIDKISTQNNLLIDRLLLGLQGLNIQINSPSHEYQRGGTVVVQIQDMERAKIYFADKGLWVDQRNQGFRISPHVYNQIFEIDAILEIMDDLYRKNVKIILPEQNKPRRFGSL